MTNQAPEVILCPVLPLIEADGMNDFIPLVSEGRNSAYLGHRLPSEQTDILRLG
jgi:hypothetical protein